jgi:hypothetical protein
MAEDGKLVVRDKEKITKSFQTLAMDAKKRFGQTSRMKREFHVRFCEGFRVKLPLTTRRLLVNWPLIKVLVFWSLI